MALDRIEQSGDRSSAINLVASELEVGPQSLRRWVGQAEIARQSRARRMTAAAARVLFPEPVQLPRIKDSSVPAKALLAAGALTIVAGMVLLVIAPQSAAQRPGWEVTAGEADALAGLLFGGCLVLAASRRYLLGVPGCAACSFLAILLATFAGLTLYITGFAQRATFGIGASARYQHVAVALALAGVVAAFLLMATPWSPYREAAQPCLVAIAVLSPTLALAALSGAGAFKGGFGSLPALGGDPILAVASVAGLLAIPLLVASSVEWVSGCVGAGFRLAKWLVARPAWLGAIACADLLWLGLGSLGWLPGWLGGQLGAWALVRGARPDAWILAVALTALTVLFVRRVRGRLDLAEATSASYIPTTLVFYSSIAGGLLIAYSGVRLVVQESVPAAVPGIVLCILVFALAVAWLWLAPGPGARLVRAMVGVAACCAVLAAGLLWPTGALPDRISVPLPSVQGSLATFLDSSTVIAVTAAAASLFCLGAWAAWVIWARRDPVTSFDGTPGEITGYETVVLPLGCWSLVLAGAALIRMRAGIAVSAFTHPVLPDPVLFTVVAVPFAVVIALTRRSDEPVARVALTAALVLPVLAFLPFAIPAALGPTGRLAVLAVAAPIIYGVTLGGRDLNRNHGSERRLSWLAGTSAIVVPLLAYLAVVGGRRGSLTSLLIDSGSAAGGPGIGAHLRLVLLLPLFVTFVCAKPTPFAQPSHASAPSRSLAFQADAIALGVRDDDLDEIYLDRLRRHLAASSPAERARYAVRLAGRLARSSPPAQSVSAAIDVARRQFHGRKPLPAELAQARSLVAGPFRPPAADDRDSLRALDLMEALRCALRYPDDAPETSAEALVPASRHEVEDAAAALISGPHAGPQYERNLARARQRIGAQLTSIEGPFTVFEVPIMLCWLAPAMVLDDPPGVRQGVEMPGKHPYVHIGVILAALAVLAAITYVRVAGS